jgi:hypothetical protein
MLVRIEAEFPLWAKSRCLLINTPPVRVRLTDEVGAANSTRHSVSEGLRNLQVCDQENDRGGISVGDSQVVQSQDGVKLSYRPYAYTRIYAFIEPIETGNPVFPVAHLFPPLHSPPPLTSHIQIPYPHLSDPCLHPYRPLARSTPSFTFSPIPAHPQLCFSTM